MKVLFLSEYLPHARVVSGVINVHQRVTLLAARGHTVGLAAFLRPHEKAHVAELRPLVSEMELLSPPPAPRGLARADAGWLSPRPFPFGDVWSRAMQRLVGRMVERSHYDVAVAEFTVMGQYLYRNPFLPAVRRVISCHSCLTTSTAKAAQLAPRRWGSLRKRLLLPRLRRYEFALYRSADLVLTLTAEEKLDLLRYEPDLRIGVVPYGVDVDHFRPKRGTGEGPSLVFTGYYRQEDNRDAVGWFARSVWPVLRDRWPALTWYVVGSGPTREIAELGRRDPRIVVTGEVEDVAPYLARARVYVCPMRLGTGFRGKILQAMAAGVPVVATTLAAEGIPAQTGESMLLADTAHTQIEAINLLLGEPSLRRRIASKARELAVSRFAWSRCVDLLEQELHQVVG